MGPPRTKDPAGHPQTHFWRCARTSRSSASRSRSWPKNAQISKATFYLHYHDIYELSEALQEGRDPADLIQHHAGRPVCEGTRPAFTRELFGSFFCAPASDRHPVFRARRRRCWPIRIEQGIREHIFAIVPERRGRCGVQHPPDLSGAGGLLRLQREPAPFRSGRRAGRAGTAITRSFVRVSGIKKSRAAAKPGTAGKGALFGFFRRLLGVFLEAERADKVDDRNGRRRPRCGDAGGHDDVEHAADQRDHAPARWAGGRLGAVAGPHAGRNTPQRISGQNRPARTGTTLSVARLFGRGRRKNMAAGDNAQHEHQSAADQLQHGKRSSSLFFMRVPPT